jgi:murein DD-endopeptidase MepM/ murein hydrolase activator NlpD
VKRHHLGTDIANQTGTAIYAGSSGVVTLAEHLHIYGNSIIINHGQGVSTSYNHLSEIEVAVGDKVEKNQQIGLMGATGQVTGPHLHWHMAVNGVAVAPEQWIEVSFSTPKHVLDPIEGTNLSSER